LQQQIHSKTGRHKSYKSTLHRSCSFISVQISEL
jgi:hypothetical protein